MCQSSLEAVSKLTLDELLANNNRYQNIRICILINQFNTLKFLPKEYLRSKELMILEFIIFAYLFVEVKIKILTALMVLTNHDFCSSFYRFYFFKFILSRIDDSINHNFLFMYLWKSFLIFMKRRFFIKPKNI